MGTQKVHKTIPKTNTRRYQRWAVYLAWIAGILYCSWPLGYVLNRPVGTMDLASALEALGQPYNWLFIALDVVSGALLVLVAVLIWSCYGKKRNTLLFVILASFALFGILTIADALLPLSCVPALTHCIVATESPAVVAHGLVNILSAVSLFVNVLLVWWHHHGRRVRYHTAIDVILGAGIVFGTISFLLIFLPGTGNLAQHCFIILCSIWLILVPYILLTRPRRV